MVQTALHVFSEALSLLFSLWRPFGVLFGVLLLILLLLGLFDRQRLELCLRWLAKTGQRVAFWVLAVLGVGFGIIGLHVTRVVTDARLSTEQRAYFANHAYSEGRSTTQMAPTASILNSKTYQRSLTLPQDIYAQIKIENGWQRLLPFLGHPAQDTVQDIQEGFTRQDGNLVYQRRVSMLKEQPIGLEKSNIQTQLQFVNRASGRDNYYDARFQAEYSFANPHEESKTMRFQFPLPQSGGTLSNFRMTVNGQEFRASELIRGSVWQGEVGAGQQVKVKVTYRNQGAKAWNYRPGKHQDAVRDFSLTVQSNRSAKFPKYALFPTQQQSDVLGREHTTHWKLKEAITAQEIRMVFAQSNLRETLNKIGWMKLLAVGLAVFLIVVWAILHRLSLKPLEWALSSIGLSLGLVFGSVLGAYLPIGLAEVIGVIIGVTLGLFVLGQRFWPPLLCAAVMPLAFLSGGHASLLLVLLLIGILFLFVQKWHPNQLRFKWYINSFLSLKR